jgi:hypothetical protein
MESMNAVPKKEERPTQPHSVVGSDQLDPRVRSNSAAPSLVQHSNIV